MPHVVNLEEKEPFISNDDHLNSHDGDTISDNFGKHASVDVSATAQKYGRSEVHLQVQSHRSPYMMKISSAVFYAVASFLITVVNKVVLTSYK